MAHLSLFLTVLSGKVMEEEREVNHYFEMEETHDNDEFASFGFSNTIPQVSTHFSMLPASLATDYYSAEPEQTYSSARR